MPLRAGLERVFVYGTLRSQGGADHLLSRATPAGPATVRGRLLAGPGYPALELEGSTEVRGEVWLCDAETIAALDSYEGVEEGLFRRATTEIDGAPVWVYVAGEVLRRRALPVIESGDWLTWSRSDRRGE